MTSLETRRSMNVLTVRGILSNRFNIFNLILTLHLIEALVCKAKCLNEKSQKNFLCKNNGRAKNVKQVYQRIQYCLHQLDMNLVQRLFF